MNKTEDFIDFVFHLLDENKASNIVVLNVRELCSFSDYFLLATAQSPLHLKHLKELIEIESKQRYVLHHVEGNEESGWILIDFFDIIIHLFLKEKRDFYSLEYLWGDAKRTKIS